ncbi:MAG: hypothetical protein NT048_02690 [Flavobacterium sp.]|nr:hypothetical protein [Flavobacterium sp.]
MKKIYLLLVLLLSSVIYAQTNGITYQAVILNPEGDHIPGYNNERAPLVNTQVCLRFIIYSGTTLEYQEDLQTTTDEFGMVNAIIGMGIPSGGSASNFGSIIWNGSPKSLAVEIDFKALCTSFIGISNQPFTAVPYALYSASSGTNGAAGPQGPIGLTGAQGVAGPQGPIGLTGAQGVAGPQGPIGLTGEQGAAGPQGPIGLTGEQGVAGPQGPIGLTGPQGADGPQGIQGVSGLSTVGAISSIANLNGASITAGELNLAPADENNGGVVTTADQTFSGTKTFTDTVTTNTINTTTLTATSVTSPFYASIPQVLVSGSDIIWDPINGLNASVTLDQNSTLSFSNTPSAGTYGTLVITQDATGGRTITLPSLINKVLGSASSTTIALSTAAGAQDILNFYYDGTNCYWNIGQGYGQAATAPATDLASGVSGTLSVTNGGTGSSTQNFVDLTTAQTVAGDKSFTSEVTASSFIKSGGTATEFLMADGSTSNGSSTSVGAISTSSTVNGASITAGELNLAPADENNGGVVTTGNQLFAGNKAFNSDLNVNGVTIGKGAGTGNYNTALGTGALRGNIGSNNTAVGSESLYAAAGMSGNENTSVGSSALYYNQSGSSNTAIGYQSLFYNENSNNTAIGNRTLVANVSGSGNTALGNGANVGSDNLTNATAIGNGATVYSNDTIQLGNSSVTNVNTSGAITGASFIKSGGSATEFLKADGSVDTNTYLTTTGTAANVSGIVGIANGGTGSSTQNFVDLTTAQIVAGAKSFTSEVTASSFIKSGGTATEFLMADGTTSNGSSTSVGAISTSSTANGASITAGELNLAPADENNGGVVTTGNQTFAGNKTFNSDLKVNGITVGLGLGNQTNNTAIGNNVLANNITGIANTGIGSNSLTNSNSASFNVGIGFESLRSTTSGGSNVAIGRNSMYSNTTGDVNTAIGESSLVSNIDGRYNTAMGIESQAGNTSGGANTAVGASALDKNVSGSNNAVLGAFAGRYIADGSTFNSTINNSVLIGYGTRPLADASNNEIVIGYAAVGSGSNTVTLGNSSVTNVNTSGSITANAAISSEIIASLTIDSSNAEEFKGKVMICNPNNEITITFSNDLPLGFNCMVLQKSTDSNKINFAGGSGVTMKNRNNFTATAGNYAIATIVNIGGGIIVTAGDMQ